MCEWRIDKSEKKMSNEIMLVIDDNGVAHEHKKPYAIIECKTKEDFEKLKEAHEKQIAKKPITRSALGVNIYYCPSCKKKNVYRLIYCNECGQKLNWSENPESI